MVAYIFAIQHHARYFIAEYYANQYGWYTLENVIEIH